MDSTAQQNASAIDFFSSTLACIGSAMILAKKDSVGNVQKALAKHYYKPNKLKPAIIPCVTTEGAGLTEF